jgi:hypothetical protein
MEKAAAPPSADTRIHPTPLSRTRPEADSALGQNCGGHPFADIAAVYRQEHICLFCELSGAENGNAVVFGTDVLLRNGILHPTVSKRLKQTSLCRALVLK